MAGCADTNTPSSTNTPPNTNTSTDTDNPILPDDYVKMLKVGMDVDWSKTDPGQEQYDSQEPIDYKEKGLSHVRIRIRDRLFDTNYNETVDVTNSDGSWDTKKAITSLEERLYEHVSKKHGNNGLDAQIQDSLDAGLIPIVAYQASEFKSDPKNTKHKGRDQAIAWWEVTAKRYKDLPYQVAYNLIIEVTDDLKKDTNALNGYYKEVIPKIRKIDPYRILIVAPNNISDPEYLIHLDYPHDDYIMVEWHFYAAGPQTNQGSRKRWITGTLEEQAFITNKIYAATTWTEEKNIPTWVGAWMANNYNAIINDGPGSYTIDEQKVFSAFMSCHLLTKNNIPFAVNSDTKFYDRQYNEWIHKTNENKSDKILDIMIEPSKLLEEKDSLVLPYTLNKFNPETCQLTTTPAN